MPIRIKCPSCARVGKAPDEALGRTGLCPACKHRYMVTADLVEPEVGYGLDPAQKPKAMDAEDIYGLDPESIQRPKRPVTRPAAVPEPADEETPESEGGLTLPVPALVGGGVAGLTLVAVLMAWGLGLFGGRAPAVDPSKQALVAQTVATPPTTVEPAPNEGTVGEISVVAMLLLDQPPISSPAEPESESDIVAKARSGAAAVAAGNAEEGKALSTAEIVEESEPSVALIKGKGSSGTGFLVAPGLVATNAHVIDDEFASDLEVRFVSADESHNDPIHAVLLYEDAERDLAFLAVPTDLKPLRVAKTYTFRKGEDVTVIGNPGMGDGQVLENAISRGVMSTKAKINEKNFYQLNIAINPGNSGGPVFDSAGRVIGVATLKSTKQEATGFSIPIEDLQAAIAKVGSQTPLEADKCRSKHRTAMAVKALGGGGAVMCLLIDLRKADAQTKNPAIKELLTKLETAAEILEKEMIPTLTVESQLVRDDTSVTPSIRNMIGEISDNFTKLRTAVSTKKSIDDAQLRTLKQNYRRLITGLSSSLKIEFPKDMMVAFDDHAPNQTNIAAMPPSNLGSRLQPRAPGVTKRPPTARDRLQQKKSGGR